jgi:ketosteroid isomerase-like protein
VEGAIVADIPEQLIAAMNRHDAEAVAAFFAVDYRSEQPLHPNRGFGGSQQVLSNWTSVFEGVPDFVAVQVASVIAGDMVWTEMHWQGTYRDGTPFLMRGVTVLGVRDDKITWARLYMEPVEQGGTDIQGAVRELYRPPQDADGPEAR